DKAAALFQAGNYKDAYNSLRRLALDSANDPQKVGKDLELGLVSLQKLGRIDETDDFIEAVAAVHAKNWRLLEAAAQGYENAPHFGFIVAGKFNRGNRRGGARYVSTMQRDRVRALQLMQQALDLTRAEKDTGVLASFYVHF